MDEHELAPIRVAEPDLLITCGFSIILKRSLLDLPCIGCVNVHSSLLPKHRGPNPFCQVILQEEERSGVTFHVTEETIDSGDILDQRSYALGPDDTAIAAYLKACALVARRVVPVVDAIAENGLQGLPQDPALAQYDRKLRGDDVRIDWTQPAKDINRAVRAHTIGLYARFLHTQNLIRVAISSYDDTPTDKPPGTVIQTQPHTTVATGKGTLTLLAAYTASPITWPWPAPWTRIKIGDILD
jgi:methionyl-tRNA formyltransferase